MKNSQIYRRILSFSGMQILFTLMGLALMLLVPVLFFLIAMTFGDETVTAVITIIGLVLGIIANALVARYAGYLFTCGQIAVIERGVSTGELPDNAYKYGKAAVKARFVTATVYFALRSITSKITSEITRGVNAVTSSLDKSDNKTVSTIGNVVSLIISIVLEYVNYCSLGWVFHNKDQNAFKSTCDGAVIYFQNWKTLLKNLGRILALTIVSLIVLLVPLCVLFAILFDGSSILQQVCSYIDVAFEIEAGTSIIIAGFICSVLLWSGLHSAFVKPYILVGVMRAYITAGDTNPPKVDVYGKLVSISNSFKKALAKAKESIA